MCSNIDIIARPEPFTEFEFQPFVCLFVCVQCKFWTVSGFCHCNAHKRSVYWKSLRDTRIMGYLHELKFTFDPADMDSDLRRAGAHEPVQLLTRV